MPVKVSRKPRCIWCDGFSKRDKEILWLYCHQSVLLWGGLTWVGLSRKPEWVELWSLGLCHCLMTNFCVLWQVVNTIEGDNWFHWLQPFPIWGFLGKISILGIHCLNGLIAQEDTSISLLRTSQFLSGWWQYPESEVIYIQSLARRSTSEVTNKTVIAIIREFGTEGLKP